MSEQNDIICDGCDRVISGDNAKSHVRFKAKGLKLWGYRDRDPQRLDLCADCWRDFWRRRRDEIEAQVSEPESE